MSRVYDALKKAEGERAADQARKNGVAVPAESFRRVLLDRPAIPADCPPIQLDRLPNGADHSPNGFELPPPLHVDSSPREIALPTARPQRIASTKHGQGPLLVMNQPTYARAAEQFHLFAASLQSWALEEQKRVYMITSSVSGEGKSFFALNLAAGLAQIGERVMLVDADLR